MRQRSPSLPWLLLLVAIVAEVIATPTPDQTA